MVERRHNALGELVTVSEATVKVRIDGETVMSVGRGQRSGATRSTRRCARISAAIRAIIADLELVDYKVRILTGGTDAVTRVLIESRDGDGQPLVHRRRLAEYRRRLLRGAARFHQLQADPRRRPGALIGRAGARIMAATVRFRLPRSISDIRIAPAKGIGSHDCAMRGLVVAFLLLLCCSPAFPQVVPGAAGLGMAITGPAAIAAGTRSTRTSPRPRRD